MKKALNKDLLVYDFTVNAERKSLDLLEKENLFLKEKMQEHSTQNATLSSHNQILLTQNQTLSKDVETCQKELFSLSEEKEKQHNKIRFSCSSL